MHQKTRRKGLSCLCRKASALFTLACFIFTSLFPNSSLAFAQSPQAIPSFSNPSLNIPQELAHVDEIYAGRVPGKTLYYIQDAHDSLEAQENIAKLIQHFTQDRDVKTVFEEGYEGEVPTEKFFGFIEDSAVKKKTAYFLLDKLRIGGAEYAHVLREKDFKLIGVDNLALYGENIEWYRKAAKTRAVTERELKRLENSLSKLVNARLPKNLKQWMKNKERFLAGKLPLFYYLKTSAAVFEASLGQTFAARYPLITMVLNAPKNTEKDQPLEALDSKGFFEELKILENDISRLFLQTETERKVFDYFTHVQLLQRLNAMELSQPEFEAAKKILAALNTEEMAAFIARHTKKPVAFFKAWEKNLQNTISFYETAKARDASVMSYLRTFLKNPDEKEAILVFGGFHAAGIKEILKEQGLSFAVLSPAITSADEKHSDYYRQLMAKGHYRFEKNYQNLRAARPESTFFVANRLGEPAVRSELHTIASVIENLEADLATPILHRTIEKTLASLRIRQTNLKDAFKARSETRAEDLFTEILQKSEQEILTELTAEEFEAFRFIKKTPESEEDYREVLAELTADINSNPRFFEMMMLTRKIDDAPTDRHYTLHFYVYYQLLKLFFDSAPFDQDEKIRAARTELLVAYLGLHMVSTGSKSRERLSAKVLTSLLHHHNPKLFYPSAAALFRLLANFANAFKDTDFNDIPAQKKRVVELTRDVLTSDANSPGYPQAISNLFRWMNSQLAASESEERRQYRRVIDYVLRSIELEHPELARTIREMYERETRPRVIAHNVMEVVKERLIEKLPPQRRRNWIKAHTMRLKNFATKPEGEEKITLSDPGQVLAINESEFNEVVSYRRGLGGLYEPDIDVDLQLRPDYATFASAGEDHTVTSVHPEIYQAVKEVYAQTFGAEVIDEFDRIHKLVWFSRGLEARVEEGFAPLQRRARYRRDALTTRWLLQKSFEKNKEKFVELGISNFNEYFLDYMRFFSRFMNNKDSYLAALDLEHYYRTVYFDEVGNPIPVLEEARLLLEKTFKQIEERSPELKISTVTRVAPDYTRIVETNYWVVSPDLPERRPVVIVPSLGAQDVSARALSYTLAQLGYHVLSYDIAYFGRSIPYQHDRSGIENYLQAAGLSAEQIKQDVYKRAPRDLLLLLDKLSFWPEANRHRISMAGHHGTQWFVDLFQPDAGRRPETAPLDEETQEQLDILRTRVQHIWSVKAPRYVQKVYGPLVEVQGDREKEKQFLTFPKFLSTVREELPVWVSADATITDKILNSESADEVLTAMDTLIRTDRPVTEMIRSAEWIRGKMKTPVLYHLSRGEERFGYLDLAGGKLRHFAEGESREYRLRPIHEKINISRKELMDLDLVMGEEEDEKVVMKMRDYFEQNGLRFDTEGPADFVPVTRKLTFFYNEKTHLIAAIDPVLERQDEQVLLKFDERGNLISTNSGAIDQRFRTALEDRLNRKFFFAVNYTANDTLEPSLKSAEMAITSHRPLVMINQKGEAVAWQVRDNFSFENFKNETYETWPQNVGQYLESRPLDLTLPRNHRSEVRTATQEDAERMIRGMEQYFQPSVIFVNAQDFPNLSDEQKREYISLAEFVPGIKIVIYEETGEIQDERLRELTSLDRVSPTPKAFAEAVQEFARPGVARIHLSKSLHPESTLIKTYKDRILFFKDLGNIRGTPTAALLLAFSSSSEFTAWGMRPDEDGFWTVADSFTQALNQSYENILAVSWSA